MDAVNIALALVLVGANGFFVATEFAIARLRPGQVDKWVSDGRPGAKSVQHAILHIDSYLAACQLGITISSLGLGALGEPAFHHILEPVFGEAATVLGISVASALAFGIITLLHVVVGELAPKSLAISRTQPIALFVAPVMRVFYFATKPIVDLFNGMGNLLLKPFGIPPAREAGHAPVSEDELRTLVRESAAGGEIEEEEQRFTENVLTFGDRRVREVMMPRSRVVFVTTDASFDEAVDVIRESGLTRLPLCKGDAGLDAPVGLLHVKDLLVNGPDKPLEEIARQLERVPESMLIDELLERLRKLREHFALVVDEHGTVIGLITLEDILEEIVGEIEDEFDPQEREPMRDEPEGTVIAGWAPIRLVEERLGVEFRDHHEATIGGVVLEHLGRLPDEGEEIEVHGVRLAVLGAADAQIQELRVVSRPEEREERERPSRD
jgi:CBS domain containing-hemolysin-like protein